MNFDKLGLVIIKGCRNLEELKQYRKIMDESADFKLPPQVRPVEISESNFKILINEGRSFEEYFIFSGEEDYKATEESVLPPEEFGESEGIPTPKPSTDSVAAPIEEPSKEVTNDSPKAETKKEAKKKNKKDKKNKKGEKAEPSKDSKVEEKAKQTQKPAQNESQKPAEKPKQQQTTYPTGSEGDDPLFDMP
jgi:hypothetical protein